MLDAFATKYGYNPATDGTKAQFAKRRLAAHIQRIVVEVESGAAGDAAATATAAQSTTDLSGVN